MSKLNFLENLKQAVESGEFNSDVAKKLIEVNEIANSIDKSSHTIEAKQILVDERIDNCEKKRVTPEEAAIANAEYEKQMEKIKVDDILNRQKANITNLEDIENIVMLSILDMFEFINTIEEEFGIEKDKYPLLFVEVEKVKIKYKSIINN